MSVICKVLRTCVKFAASLPAETASRSCREFLRQILLFPNNPKCIFNLLRVFNLTVTSMAARPPVEDSDDDEPLFGPRPLQEVVPLTTLPVIMVVAPPVPPVPPPDSDSYRDIDDAAIEVGEPMQEARPSAMQVKSAHADRSSNLSCSLKFQPTIEWIVLYLCRLEEQVLQLLRAKIRSLELNKILGALARRQSPSLSSVPRDSMSSTFVESYWPCSA